jgi:beta-glucanase (GH16 family)
MTSTPAVGASGATEVLFSDDFSSGALDRARWNVDVTGDVVNDEQQAYVDDPETLYVDRHDDATGGHCLVIHPRHRPGFTIADGRSFDFVSGRINTRDRFHFRYGTASARIKLPAGRGLWPALWLLGCGAWPGTGEIDVMENVGEPDWVSAAVHGPGYSGEAGLVNRSYFSDGDAATDWHVYRVRWAPDELVFLVDDRMVHRVTRPMVDFFGRWAFDEEKFLVLNLAVGGTYPFKINGIRSPYHGVAAETVDAIVNAHARVLVDWVEVTA